uniref:Putative secreted protein n=1 Tax=Anopheles darlingi TaxID=43151 RepID=A0A2M4DCV0_ANODA
MTLATPEWCFWACLLTFLKNVLTSLHQFAAIYWAREPATSMRRAACASCVVKPREAHGNMYLHIVLIALNTVCEKCPLQPVARWFGTPRRITTKG